MARRTYYVSPAAEERAATLKLQHVPSGDYQYISKTRVRNIETGQEYPRRQFDNSRAGASYERKAKEEAYRREAREESAARWTRVSNNGKWDRYEVRGDIKGALGDILFTVPDDSMIFIT